MDEPVLSVVRLNKRFGRKEAVKDISFHVHRGEILGILGPNGAGKTTAIRMMMGVLEPDSGEVRYHLNSQGDGRLNKSHLGYLPEERGLYDDVPVLRTLTYLAELKGVPAAEGKKRAEQWLEIMALQDYGRTKLEKLSKGMQQKVQFIAAVLHRPPLVLLDEPFSGLDPINQDLFKNLIRKLQDDGTTVLLSAHQMNMVEELCSRIFMIHQGKEILYGTVQDIKDNFHEFSVQIGLADPQRMASFLQTYDGVRHVQVNHDGLSFRLSSDRDMNHLLEEMVQLGTLQRVVIQKPSLHEIFISTVADKEVQS